MKNSIVAHEKLRLGLAIFASCVGISLSNQAKAESIETPPHRVEFKVSKGLPKCDDYDAFYGILVNFVRIRSVDPTAKRKISIEIKLLPDGRKREELSIWNEDGGKIEDFVQTYPRTEECFKVLYWAAYDSAVLMSKTVPPPEVEPPMAVDKLVQEAEKPDVVKKEPESGAATGPIYDEEFYSEPKAKAPTVDQVVEPNFPYRLVAGFGVTAGLTRVFMPGFRVGFGKTVGPITPEIDVHVLPPLTTATWSTDRPEDADVTAKAQGYLGSLAICAQKNPLFGCGVVMGGLVGHEFDKPVFDGERFSHSVWGGVLTAGLRAGVNVTLSPHWAFRFDVDLALPLYASDVLRPKPRFGEDVVGPTWMGHLSIVPSW